MSVLIIGSRGMLGQALVEEAAKKDIPVTVCSHYILNKQDAEYVINAADNIEAIINAAGVIQAHGRRVSSYSDMITANSILPLLIGQEAKKRGIPFLHVSTDCVFSGNKPGLRRTIEAPDPVDVYGISKRLGEEAALINGAVVVRTSFIGMQHGLLKWLLEQDGSSIEGYKNTYWTGSYVNEVARSLLDLLKWQGLSGIQHLATERVYSKHEILETLIGFLELDIKLTPVDKPVSYRGLRPSFTIRGVTEVIEEIVEQVQSYPLP